MQVPDPRHISHGAEIPSENYADQPYIVRTDDGSWLCVMTTGRGREGAQGQHVVTTRSNDHGRTWEPLVDVEPSDGPEASYAVLLKVPGGRIYCFYNHNSDDLRAVLADDPPYPGGLCYRVDSQGHFVLKYSDDHGRTWSAQRTPIPIREMQIDRQNAYAGAIQFFWNVGRPFVHDGAAYVSLHKVGGFGEGFFTRSEGVLLKSRNILTERDPEQIAWETLPDGDYGLRAPAGGGPIAEEQSYAVLSDGSFFSVYRTIDGHPACCYSRDRGRTWSAPEYMRYGNGRLFKHPRAANFCWRCENGHYLYWYHNHGGNWYEDRNPVWLSGGLEIDSPEGKLIRWSQPEIALYDDDPYVRMSYPDLVQEGGRYYVAETQKEIARVHELDPQLLAGLWQQQSNTEVSADGLVLSLPVEDQIMPNEAEMPPLPVFLERDNSRPDYGTRDLCHGFTIELWLRLDELVTNQVILDSRLPSGQGLALAISDRGTVEVLLNDGRTHCRWDTDPGMISEGQSHHLAVVVDGGPKIITFIVDGVLCDGGTQRQFGWGRYNPNLRHVNGSETLRIAPELSGQVVSLRVYDRALRTSQVIASWWAGL